MSEMTEKYTKKDEKQMMESVFLVSVVYVSGIFGHHNKHNMTRWRGHTWTEKLMCREFNRGV